MIVRSKAPLRIGLSGGGTDVSPYSDIHGGVVLNATIDQYAYCTIKKNSSKQIIFNATDLNKKEKFPLLSRLPINNNLILHKGVYNRIINDYNDGNPISFTMTTYSDAPPGSGLGSSSTMVVAIIKAFVELLSLPLGEYDIANLAYEIERIDLKLSGGKQDQYAATFGGFNFIEFYEKNKVIVNPLRIKNWIKNELESSMVLYYTGVSRYSSKIIDDQKTKTKKGNVKTITAMHKLKDAAYLMKDYLLKGDVDGISDVLNMAWSEKKKTTNMISNNNIEEIFKIAMTNGAKAGKVSGAGGGGFIVFIVDPIRKVELIKKLCNTFDGKVFNFNFSYGGTHGWKII